MCNPTNPDNVGEEGKDGEEARKAAEARKAEEARKTEEDVVKGKGFKRGKCLSKMNS